jgi:protocatechuate 3,4-dioxygenase beta subunit
MNPKYRFTRRRFLASSVALATTLELQRTARAFGLAKDPDVCRLTAEQEVGPYFVTDALLRSDIAEDRTGVPLALRLVLLDARTCRPLANAAVDVWHCDALGIYSGYTKQSMMAGPGGPPPGFDPQHSRPPGRPPDGFGQMKPTDAKTFLRGVQITDADGAVAFRTIFPGYYMGRTNHIHFKVRLDGRETGKSYAAGHTSHIGQVFFPEEMTVQLMKQEPYRLHRIHRTTQAEDGIFGSQYGGMSVAKLRPSAGAGFAAELVAAVDPTAMPAPVHQRDGRGGPDGSDGPPSAPISEG